MHLEDLPADAELVERELKKGNLNFEKLVVANRSDFQKALIEFQPQLILSDHSLPSFNSIEALEIVRSSGINIPFILITATVSEEFAVSVIQQGAEDYILKDNLYRLPSAITQAMDKKFDQLAKLKAETELTIAHERLLFHLENSPLGYIEWDSQLMVRSMSKKAEEIFGWNKQEFNTNRQTGFSPVHLTDQPEIFKMQEELLDGTVQSIKIQYRSYTKSGKIIWCEWFNSVLKNPDGKVITVLSLVQDITDQKKSEEALVNNELRFREFFETAPEALFVLDPSTRKFVDYNDNALRLLKCSGPELLQKTMESISRTIGSENTDSKFITEENILRTMNNEHPVFELVVIDSYGIEIYCEFRLNVLTNNQRPLIRASVLDITERVLLEGKLAEIRIKKQIEITEAIITAQERERSFLGEELHDNINQVLATSKLYLDRAIASPHLRDDLMTSSRNYIYDAMEEIRKLSKSLLPPSLGEITLLEAVTEMIDNLHRVNKINFIKAWYNFDESVLNEKQSLGIFRILQEQLNNVIKHARAKNVIIGLSEKENKIQLQIKDDGVGFELTEKRKGIGLKNIASRTELLNGELIINSSPGNGFELLVNIDL